MLATLATACAHRPPPRVTCGAGWSPLSPTSPVGYEHDVAISTVPDRVISAVVIAGVAPELVATLERVLETRAGQRIQEAPFRADLRRLWALGVVSDAHLELDGGVVTFSVTPRPAVGRVVGADGDALRRFRLLAGAPFEPVRFARIAAGAELALVQAGHLDAKVAVERAPGAHGDGIDVCVAQRPGPRVTIARVRFPGRSAVPEATLLAAIHGEKGGVNHVGGTYDADALAVDQVFLSAAYWDRGFALIKVGEPRLIRHGPKLDVEIPVVEGPVFRYGTIAGNVVNAPLGIRRGDVFSRSKVAAARDKLADLTGASVVPVTNVDVEHRRIDLTFELQWRWPWDVLRLWSSPSR
jgi:outer membrane protein assembly factor BamA